MKTRTRKGAVAASKISGEVEAPTPKSLGTMVRVPPHVFVLPKNTSPDARIVSLQHPATGLPSRHFVCPERGFYEFTSIAAPKRTPQSWLLAPHARGLEQYGQSGIEKKNGISEADESKSNPQDAGYVLQTSALFVATPLDPLFVILPALMDSTDNSRQEFLASSDYLVSLIESSTHLRQILRPHAPGNLERMLQERMDDVCDCMDMGDDKMYALSLPRLVRELVSKARRAIVRGFPASLEEQFIKQALEPPDTGIGQEDNDIATATGDACIDMDSQAGVQSDSGDIDDSNPSSTDRVNAASPTASAPVNDSESVPAAVVELRRLRIAFDFIMASYIHPKLHSKLQELLCDPKCSGVDFGPLMSHLAHIDSLKRQAHALRSLSDNVSRKRSTIEDDEAQEKVDLKRRKMEEEENKKRQMSQGVKQLMKADTSGMKKLSAFFSKQPAKK